MPIEKMYTDAMLGTFRTMLQECKDKGLSGESFDRMSVAMQRMEDLAVEMEDFGAYSAKLTTEGLYVEFSTAYGAVLAEEAQQKYSGSGGYDDDALLQQTLVAYENSLHQLDSHQDREKLQAPIKEVIALGRSGINYPTFLRALIEKGLEKAMEGTVLSREALQKDVDWSVQLMLPVYEKRNRAILARYDEMAAVAAFGVPDTVLFEMERFRISAAYQPEINKDQAIIDRWNKLLTLLHDWIDAYTAFAPHDARYASPEGMAATMKNIKYYKECNPGFFKVREDIFNRYFSMTLNDVFTHASFENERRAKRCIYTDAYVDLLKEVYQQCKPLAQPTKELIATAESLHDTKQVFIS